MKPYYTGKEWKEKFRRENPRMRLREEPADHELIDEHGTPIGCDSILWWVILISALIAIIIEKRE